MNRFSLRFFSQTLISEHKQKLNRTCLTRENKPFTQAKLKELMNIYVNTNLN